jgi:hypothetical protein
VLAHGTNVLKNQWGDVIKTSGFKFAYDPDIFIPQNYRNIDYAKYYDLIVVDEAHEFYLADHERGQVQQIIEKLKGYNDILSILNVLMQEYIKEKTGEYYKISLEAGDLFLDDPYYNTCKQLYNYIANYIQFRQ